MTDHAGNDFIDAYNLELERLGCGARVRRPTGAEHEEMLEIVDLDDTPIGVVPDEIEPAGMAAFMLVIERAFEEGVAVGKSLSGSTITPNTKRFH